MQAGPEITLIFDGDCGFCTTAANYAVARSKYPIRAVPWQRCELASYGLTPEKAAIKVYVVARHEATTPGEPKFVSAYGGHEAFAALLRLHPDGYLRLVGATMMVPPFSWISAIIYAVVAKYRHKLPGGTPACKIE